MSVIHNYVSFTLILFLCFHLITFSSPLQHGCHAYYNSTILAEPTEAMKYWVNIDNMPNVTLHPMLSKSRRRAEPVSLAFEFPFYGHPINNVIISTRGFLHLGNTVHDWHATSQYIAPLMANFDTRLNESSIIKCSGNLNMFVAQWENVVIKELPNEFFTFQISLFPNGDIVFVYKDLPVAFKDIPKSVKVGLSDAYIFNKTLNEIQRTTINEYSRIDLTNLNISSHTSIYFSATPTCNTLVNRESCSIGIKGFSCKWCSAVGSCSDGYDRMRQQWLQNDCPT